MTIPGDSQCRWWIEVSAENPKLVDDYRPALIAFMAFSHGREGSLAGSGYITAVGSCGIVCADNPPDKARLDWPECGESVIASAWSALCLHVPESIPSIPETPTLSLYDFMRCGRMEEAVGGLNCIKLMERDDGDCTIS